MSLLKPGLPRVPNKLGLPSPKMNKNCKCNIGVWVERLAQVREEDCPGTRVRGDGRMENEGTTKTIVNKTGAVFRNASDKRG